MYLDVEVNLREEIKKITIVLKTARMTDLFNVPVESALLAEYVSAMRTNYTVNIVSSPHVRGQIRKLSMTLRTRQIFQPRHVDFQTVDV